MEAPSVWAYGDELLEPVKTGELSIELIDQAVSNILRVKFLAGLFENALAEPERTGEIINHPTHRKLSRRAACESMVLLRNKGNLLPLDRNIESVAVIGPNADVSELGDYCVPKSSAVTPLEGIRKAVSRRT